MNAGAREENDANHQRAVLELLRRIAVAVEALAASHPPPTPEGR